MKDYPGQTISSRIPDWRKFLHPTLPASDTNRDCLPQGRVSSDRVCNSELATSEVGPSRQMPMLGLYVSFRGIPDIERFSARTQSVANDPYATLRRQKAARNFHLPTPSQICRAPAPPAIEASKGRQRHGARHVCSPSRRIANRSNPSAKGAELVAATRIKPELLCDPP